MHAYFQNIVQNCKMLLEFSMNKKYSSGVYCIVLMGFKIIKKYFMSTLSARPTENIVKPCFRAWNKVTCVISNTHNQI